MSKLSLPHPAIAGLRHPQVLPLPHRGWRSQHRRRRARQLQSQHRDRWPGADHLRRRMGLPRAPVYHAQQAGNFECSRKPSHHPGVLTLLPEQFSWREVQPVGRLDHDTTGMLLMSDDGPFIHAQSSPKRHVPKIYQATTQEPVSQELIDLLIAGVQLHDEPAPLAAQVCIKRGEHQLEIVLEQGKYHQVKRMLAAAGNHCSALHRSAIGQLTLESLGLAEGEWCYLTEAQLALLAPA